MYGWQVGDDPRDRRWHFYGCALALGNDERNVPSLSRRPIEFVGDFVSTTESLDSGYMTANSSGIDVPSSSSGIVQPVSPVKALSSYVFQTKLFHTSLEFFYCATEG